MSKSYDSGRSYALKDLELAVEPGETLVLLGSSGSGKTTALRLVNRGITASAGEVWVDGRDVMEYDPVALRRSVGYVFQGIGLFPHLTVAENAGMVLRISGVDTERRSAAVSEVLNLVGLPPEEFGGRYPDALSGGQQQRVGVARALAAKPSYLLMDEPFGALDAVTRDALQEELVELRARLEKTILFVTHDLFEALRIGDRIAVLHEGVLQQVGDGRSLRNRPETLYVEQLFERFESQLHQGIELTEGGT